MIKQIPPQLIRQTFVILLILLMGSLIFRELLPYLTGVLGAVTIYVLMRKWMAKLVNQKKMEPVPRRGIVNVSFLCGNFNSSCGCGADAFKQNRKGSPKFGTGGAGF